VTRVTHSVAHNLGVDHATAEVLRAFESAGAASVLLKGPSIVRWLYRDRPRRYQDCDLLVPPGAMRAAEQALKGLGFAPVLEERTMPDWWREHGIEWRRPDSAVSVDLHRTLRGAGVDDQRLWDVLRRETETMLVGGFPATVLTTPGRALLLAAHTDRGEVEKGDLARAIACAGASTWRRAAELARELDAATAFSAGLYVLPQGRALAVRLDLPPARSIDAELRTTRAPPPSLTLDRLAAASGLRERATIVRHKLLPPPAFMRHWSPWARSGPAGLLVAYGLRLVWVAREVPRAASAWRRARRAVQAQPRTGA
jgi:hypothetical protein